MADSVEQLYKAQDLQEKLYPITKENAVKDNSNVSLDTKLTSINTSISNKVDKVTGKGLSTNDYTSAEKTKLAGIEDGAQVNIIESIELNGESQPIENKTAKIDISSVLENLTSGSSLKLYAQETLIDQKFSYRESPTEEDGNAKITDIKGNTIVWNQLVQNGNFADTSLWRTYASTGFSVSNNIGSFTVAESTGAIYQTNTPTYVSGHKYLVIADFYVSQQSNISVEVSGTRGKVVSANANTWYRYSDIVTPSAQGNFSLTCGQASVQVRNVMCFDLTQMGLDITDPSEFTSLFSKPYYDYCQGTMLSFGGRNVKFNQIARPLEDTTYWAIRSDTGTGNISSGVANITATKAYASLAQVVTYRSNIIGSHKYLITCNVKGSRTVNFRNVIARSQSSYSYGNSLTLTTSYQKYTRLYTAENDTNYGVIFECSDSQSGDVINIKDVQIIDLTEMFGAGNEPSAEGFRELFPNDYYEYTTGKYMNIGQPVSLKTVSKNQFNVNDANADNYVTLEKSNGKIRLIYDGANSQRYRGFYMYRTEPYVNGRFLPKQYTVSFDVVGIDTAWVFGIRAISTNSFHSTMRATINADGHYSFTFNPSELTEDYYLSASRTGNKTTAFDITFSNIQMEIGTETEYESFEESTLSIPLDEFPNGMDGINDARDEKNETGYVKRLGRVTFDGTKSIESIVTIGSYTRFTIAHGLSNVKYPNAQQRSNYLPYVVSFSEEISHFYMNGSTVIIIMPTSLIGSTRETANAYLQSNPLTIAYELATPLENYGIVDLGTLNWTWYSQYKFYNAPLNGKKVGVLNVLCDKFATRSGSWSGADPTQDIVWGNSSNNIVYVQTVTSYASVEAFKSAMQDVYLLYEKENPQGFTNVEMRYPAYAGGTEQILPENMSIPTTAPIIADIEYSYDFKAVDRIIGMLNSVAQNETSPSTHNYSVGDYLVYNYQLYKVIASISTGASLTVGTNIQATTIMNELASLS